MRRVRLEAHGPFHLDAALAMLAAHAIPGAEELDGASYRRLLAVERAGGAGHASGPGRDLVPIHLAFDAGGATLSFEAALLPQGSAGAIVARVRRWLDLDRDAAETDAILEADPIIGPLVARRPGLRLIGSLDEFEAIATTVIGQQVSLAAARTFAARLAAAYGEAAHGLRAFPAAATLAAIEIEELRACAGLTRARARTLHEVARRWAGGPVLAGLDAGAARERLLAIPGIGPWTADYMLVRGLQHPDTFAPGDLVARRALGLDQRAAAVRAEAWAPFRSFALLHLWTEAAYL